MTSARNPLLKDIRKAVRRGELTDGGYAVAESFHLLEEALRSDRDVACVVAAASVRSAVERHVGRLSGTKLVIVADTVFAEVAATESSQGVIALVRPPAWSLDHLFRGKSLVVVLDQIQDPGNAGTIVRTAEAFGATGCAFMKGAVNPYNPKTLRASAGSVFRMPIITGIDPDLMRSALGQRRLDVYAAMPGGGMSVSEADLSRRFALLIGSESHGVSEKLRGGAMDLHIPTAGVESLNAAIAAAVILYEARRQRTLR